MNSTFKNIYPKQVWNNPNYIQTRQCGCNDERLGAFLVPFIAGAAVSAPFWLIAGSNKNQPQYYPYPPNQYPYYPPFNSPYYIK